ncbi:MAG TPA: pyrroline-5-carboxylate reductase [Planctomycetaceae bacterium]|nr:pyrroline-5-carboxylate reductase [Planctomycetaceae bacterium]
MANEHANRPRVGFIGAGRMATALARGLVTSGFAGADSIVACDVDPDARRRFADGTGAESVASPDDVWSRSDVVILAVKPQQMRDVLADAKPHHAPRHLVVSIAAGVPLEAMTAALGPDARLVRVMPNTPCLVGAGAAAFALGGSATADDGELVARLFSTVGIAVPLPEKLLDAVTGLSGSGPAFVYEMIEALSDGGVRVGLPRDVAVQLAAQTVLGAARMVLETGEHPAVLKDAVASPAGTTIAGLHVLEQGGLRGLLMNAVLAATERSAELGRSS